MSIHVKQFDALGHPARLEIFRLLVRAGPDGRCVDDIKRRLKMPGSTLAHHLETLAQSRLLATRRDGKFVYHAVDWTQTAELVRFLTEDCCAEMHVSLGLKTKARRASVVGRRGKEAA